MSEHAHQASGVYAIRHLASGKAYVGSAKNMRRRWNRHRVDLVAGSHHSVKLQRAWDKHGVSAFEFEVLQTVPVHADLVGVEQMWIERLEAFSSGFNSRPNASNCLGMKQSPETVAKRLASKKGYRHAPETIEKIREANKASHGTEEARAEKSALRKSLKWSPTPEHRAAVSLSNATREVSEQTRRKRSEIMRRRVVSSATKERISLAKLNQSTATKAKISAAHKGKAITAEHREKLSVAMKGVPWSEARRAASQKNAGASNGTR